MTYFFELGRERSLSLAEIAAVFQARGISHQVLSEDMAGYAIIGSADTFSCTGLMEQLGGTVAIGSQLTTQTSPDTDIFDHLMTYAPNGKIIFSVHGPDHITLAKRVKALGKNRGISMRYIEPNNTATILHNELLPRHSDIRIIGNNIFVTEAIQPIAEFSRRDFGRPGRDDVSGMLPPKLSKIMINLAGAKRDATLLDPFCGSGTLLIEAALMGYTTLLGSDISPRAITDTKQNFEWIRQDYDTIRLPKLMVADIRTLVGTLGAKSVDTIVTEPFLGNPQTGRSSQSQLRSEAAKLLPLYEQTLEAFGKLLRPGGTIVMIIPCFRSQNEWIRLDLASAMKKNNMHAVPFAEQDYLLYARPQQHVGREIWRLKH